MREREGEESSIIYEYPCALQFTQTGQLRNWIIESVNKYLLNDLSNPINIILSIQNHVCFYYDPRVQLIADNTSHQHPLSDD